MRLGFFGNSDPGRKLLLKLEEANDSELANKIANKFRRISSAIDSLKNIPDLTLRCFFLRLLQEDTKKYIEQRRRSERHYEAVWNRFGGLIKQIFARSFEEVVRQIEVTPKRIAQRLHRNIRRNRAARHIRSLRGKQSSG